MYLLKIKGTEKIPDFVQIRDKIMTLLAYFRLSQIEKGIEKNNLTKYKQKIIDGIEENVKRVVDEATEEAKSSPVPPEAILTTNVYANGGWAWRN